MSDLTASERDLRDDLLEGADEISKFMFGDRSKRRRVYHLASGTKNPIPTFKMGSVICARRSTLLRWIAEQEKAAAG